MPKESFMLRTRIHYWSSSKFADWIRGEQKPLALEWDAWDDYYNDLKKRKPIRYWFTEKFLKWLQNTIYFPYDVYREIKIYVRNRWIDKTHYLKTGLKPGHWYEFDYRLMHGLFNELVDFVEIELADQMTWKDKEKYKFKNGRCVEAAYDYFKWANNLKNKNQQGKRVLSEQAKASRKIQKLYEWWTIKRPNRLEPAAKSAWDQVYDKIEANDFKARKNAHKYYLKMLKIEEAYDQEDEDMMIELIKIRRHLWT
jgi:hypothetical protein